MTAPEELHAEPLPGLRAVLGESPVWIERNDTFVAVDMVEGALLRYDPARETTTSTWLASYLGAVVETAAGDLACVTVDGVVLVGDDGASPLVTILTDDGLRLNDAACDPTGRLWVGSTSRFGIRGAGALHVWEPGHAPVVVLPGMTLPNGIGWAPDGSRLYVADSADRMILTAPFDASVGVTGAFESFAELDHGVPDGLAVGEDGSLWVAVWDGAEVRCYSADGALVRKIPLPVSRPTSCAFTGAGDLMVTTARHEVDSHELFDQPAAGALLRVHVGLRGAVVGRLAL